MKERWKEKVALLLVITLILSAFSGCNIENSDAEQNGTTIPADAGNIEWVLTFEKDEYSDEFANPTVYKTKEYKYDSQGTLIYEKWIYDNTTVYTGYNYKYDEKGNVISKSMKETSLIDDSYVNYSDYTYEYDANGNCIKESAVFENDNANDIVEYEYDSNGNVIKEKFKYTGFYSYEGTKTSVLTYENEVCVQREVMYESTDNYGTNVSYNVYKYEYDDNGNLSSSRYYTNIENISDAKNPVEINGRNYKLYSITSYTYENLADVATDVSSIEKVDGSNGVETTTSTQSEAKLSEQCDTILCSGYDGNDYYELVVNQIDGYPDTTFEFGVIKNNKWLIEMSEDCPFINENGWWKGASYHNLPGEVNYLGYGCFYHSQSNDWNGVLYNAKTNISFDVSGLENFTPYKRDLGYVDYTKLINENCEVLALLNDGNRTFAYLNLNTGETKAIPFELTNINQNQYIGLLGDGLFYAHSSSNFVTSDEDYHGFFDLQGNQIIDFYEYGYISDYQGYRFENGTYTMTCVNNSGVGIDITFDTSGNEVSQVKAEN